MKKQTLFVTVIVIAALFSLVNPFTASAHRATVGERIRVPGASTLDFPADTPFHIMHGWAQSSEDGAIGVFDFKLEIDGVFQTEDYMLFSADGEDPTTLSRLWVFNFPNGMTGTHIFTGHWYAPCQYAVNELGYTGPCATPNEKVENNTLTKVITFTQ